LLGWFFLTSQASSHNEFVSSNRAMPNRSLEQLVESPFDQFGFLQPIKMNTGLVCQNSPDGTTNFIHSAPTTAVVTWKFSENLKLNCIYLAVFLLLFFPLCAKRLHLGLKLGQLDLKIAVLRLQNRCL